LVNPIQNVIGTANTIDCVYYSSCGEDMQFSCLRDPPIKPTVDHVPDYQDWATSDATPLAEPAPFLRGSIPPYKVTPATPPSRSTSSPKDFDALNPVIRPQMDIESAPVSTPNGSFPGPQKFVSATSGVATPLDQLTFSNRELFRTPFPTIIPSHDILLGKTVMPDVSTSWYEIFSRPMLQQVINDNGSGLTSHVQWFNGMNNTECMALQWLYQIFQLFRGSWRYKIFPYNTKKDYMIGAVLDCGYVNWGGHNLWNPFYATCRQDGLTNNFLEVTVPFYWPWFYWTPNFYGLTTTFRNGVIFNIESNVDNVDEDYGFAQLAVTMSVGPDFLFANPSSLPTWTLT